jgi:rod shape determining protein RodA
MKWLKLKYSFNFDWTIFIIPLILSIFGIVVIYSITYGGTGQHLATNQIVFLSLGLVLAYIFSRIDYRLFKGLYLILYISVLLLLLLVLFFGDKIFGASRWIELGFFRLQPSEIFKIVALIITAKLYSDWKEIDYKKVLLSCLLIFVPIYFILKQPDLGTASVIFITFLTILFISPVKKIYLIIMLAVFLASAPIAWKMLKPYQKQRIEAFINPTSDPRGSGYNVNQAKIAVGSGGLYGKGLGKGTQSQLNFLPVAHTDFIFAGAAEATGFAGAAFLITLLSILIIRVFVIAKNAKDAFGMYVAGGIGMMFLFQMLVNVGMNMGIMPVTGIPLPFVSYGGSSMLTNMISIGILQSIYLRHKKITF